MISAVAGASNFTGEDRDGLVHLLRNSRVEREQVVFDSGRRDRTRHPDPADFVQRFDQPFRNVTGVEVMEVLAPSDRQTINDDDDLVVLLQPAGVPPLHMRHGHVGSAVELADRLQECLRPAVPSIGVSCLGNRLSLTSDVPIVLDLDASSAGTLLGMGMELTAASSEAAATSGDPAIVVETCGDGPTRRITALPRSAVAQSLVLPPDLPGSIGGAAALLRARIRLVAPAPAGARMTLGIHRPTAAAKISHRPGALVVSGSVRPGESEVTMEAPLHDLRPGEVLWLSLSFPALASFVGGVGVGLECAPAYSVMRQDGGGGERSVVLRASSDDFQGWQVPTTTSPHTPFASLTLSRHAFRLLAPYSVDLRGTLYATLRAPELETHTHSSFSYGDQSPGLALVRTSGRTEFSTFRRMEFASPLPYLSQVRLRLEARSRPGSGRAAPPDLYDLEGRDMVVVAAITYLVPTMPASARTGRSELNPNISYA
jgi:hypothetical protein